MAATGRWQTNISVKLFLICFVFVLLAVSVLDTLAYRYIKNEVTRNRLDNVQMLLTKETQYLELYFLTLQNLLSTLSSSIRALPPEEAVLRAVLEQFYEKNATLLKDLYVIRSDLSIIGGGLVSGVLDGPLPERRPLFDQVYRRPQSVSISPLYKSPLSGWTVTFAIPLRFGGEPMVLAVDLSLSALELELAEISKNTNLSIGILDLQGLVIAAPVRNDAFVTVSREWNVGGLSSAAFVSRPEDHFEVELPSGAVTLIKTIDPHYRWVIFAIVDNTALRRELRQMDVYFAGLLLLGIGLSLVLAWIVSRYIRAPVHYLIRKMKLVREGDLGVKVGFGRQDEFGQLARSFDDMLDRIRMLIADLNRTERHKNEMEIQMLQSQINPHFLYNTLGSISNAVASRRYDRVDPVINALISILEYGITDFSEHVRLDDELHNVRNYLFIQNVRYDCEFGLTERIGEELRAFPVPKMILQPIVENSIFHGYNGKSGDIVIAAFRDGDRVVIEVIDSGSGIEPNKLKRLLQPRNELPDPRSRKRIGLYNIDQRIRLYYGAQYGVAIESELGRGSAVRLTFPADRAAPRKGESGT